MHSQKPPPAQNALTAAERALLRRYVTNTEGPVFALTNLPEVIKGALFSRYSRSTLGLRELLLREFMQDPEAEFAALDSAAADTGQAADAHLAVQRAQLFYDRILDGYGDDSIAELGGAHLALEQVSMLATKVLEDARIGGSPLEKSTRYVSFADKHDGEYRFYQDPAVMASRHGARYLATMRALFDGYVALMPVLREHIAQVAPREPGNSESTWRRAVNARAYDALRGLLPAAAQTNMGIYGNGRFFETLLGRLQLEDMPELTTLAATMREELTKVIPSFIRRSAPEHPHFQALRDYQTRVDHTVRELVQGQAWSAPLSQAPSVSLVEHDPDAEARILAALLYPETQAPLAQVREWAASLPAAERAAVFSRLTGLRENRRHKLPRALETVFYTFDLVGDFGMYRDLHRHRTLTQQRQPLSPRHGYTMPPEVADAGAGERFAALMAQAGEAYAAIHADFPRQAQYVVPMACHIRWMVHINLRALMWLVELRSAPQGHPAYRWMAQQMFRRVDEVHPHLAGLMRFVDLEDHALGRLGAEQRQEEKARR